MFSFLSFFFFISFSSLSRLLRLVCLFIYISTALCLHHQFRWDHFYFACLIQNTFVCFSFSFSGTLSVLVYRAGWAVQGVLADKLFSRVIETASKIDKYVSLFVISGLHLFSFILSSFYFIYIKKIGKKACRPTYNSLKCSELTEMLLRQNDPKGFTVQTSRSEGFC